MPVRRMRSQAAQGRPTALADTSVEWSARIVQPRRSVEPDSGQPVIVAVSAPVVLDGAVQIGVGDRWVSAEWLGDPGQHRQASCPLPALRRGAAEYARVRVGDVTLRAGRISAHR